MWPKCLLSVDTDAMIMQSNRRYLTIFERLDPIQTKSLLQSQKRKRDKDTWSAWSDSIRCDAILALMDMTAWL